MSLVLDQCLTHGGAPRCWDQYVPPGATTLVIDLHGRGGTKAYERRASGWATLAASEGFAVLWPEALLSRTGTPKKPDWNAGGYTSLTQSADDVGFLVKLARRLRAEHAGLARVFFTGLSHGCAMAQRMASEASEVVSGVACHAMYSLGPLAAGYSAVPVFVILGEADAVVSFTNHYGRSGAKNLEHWRAANGCVGAEVLTNPTYSGRVGTDRVYNSCQAGTEARMLSIAGLGHLTVRTPATVATAWQFLRRFPVGAAPAAAAPTDAAVVVAAAAAAAAAVAAAAVAAAVVLRGRRRRREAKAASGAAAISMESVIASASPA